MRQLVWTALLISAGCSNDVPDFQPLPQANRPLEPLRRMPMQPSATPGWPPPPPPPPAVPRPPPPPAPPTTSLNGDPKGPSAAALSGVLQGAMPQLQACVQGAPVNSDGELRASISYQVVAEGKATGVSASGGVPADALACMKRTVEGLSFPAFQGPAVAGSLPVVVRRVAAPAPPPPPPR